VFNQFTEHLSVRQIAETIAEEYPGDATIETVENPRVEAENHYYNAKHTALVDLGLQPTLLSMALIDHLFDVVERHRDRVDLAAIMPTVSWRATTSELPQTSAGALAQT
jgi:UDP-sulfoquinovose synthase